MCGKKSRLRGKKHKLCGNSNIARTVIHRQNPQLPAKSANFRKKNAKVRQILHNAATYFNKCYSLKTNRLFWGHLSWDIYQNSLHFDQKLRQTCRKRCRSTSERDWALVKNDKAFQTWVLLGSSDFRSEKYGGFKRLDFVLESKRLIFQ